MNDNREKWIYEKNRMMQAIVSLGFPKNLGEAVAMNLGSPKAMSRMTSYLVNVKPKTAELVVDEMLAIKSDVDAWRQKKESEAANASVTEYLNSPERYFEEDDDEDYD